MGEVDFLAELAKESEPTMTIPALKGRLGNVDYFVITMPFGSLPRYVLPTDPSITDPKQRENRKPRPERFREIAQYIIENMGDYRFSALTCTYGKAGTEKPVNWRPSTETGPGQNIGLLTLAQQDPLVIVDGQHRLGAIQEAAEKEPSLRDESIPIVLFPYIDIDHAQQLFSDLNRTARKTTKSLDILFDHRDFVNKVVQDLVDRVSFLGDAVNLEDVSVPTYSGQVFTLAGLYQASKPVLDAASAAGFLSSKERAKPEEYVDWLAGFWEFLGDCFPEWRKVADGALDIRLVRSQYLHWNSGVLSAVGEFAAYLIKEKPTEWKALLAAALESPQNAGWRRNAEHWRGIATAGTTVLPRSALRASLLKYLKEKVGEEAA